MKEELKENVPAGLRLSLIRMQDPLCLYTSDPREGEIFRTIYSYGDVANPEVSYSQIFSGHQQ